MITKIKTLILVLFLSFLTINVHAFGPIFQLDDSDDRYKDNVETGMSDLFYSTYSNLFGGNTHYIHNDDTLQSPASSYVDLSSATSMSTKNLTVYTTSPTGILRNIDGVVFSTASADDLFVRHCLESEFRTQQQRNSVVQSAGWITGGAFTNNGDGTLKVSSGTGLIRSINSSTAPLMFCNWNSSDNIQLIDQEEAYVYVVANGGGMPEVMVSPTLILNGNTYINLGLVFREGNEVHPFRAGLTINNFQAKVIQTLTADGLVKLKSGALVAETGERYLTVTDGVVSGGITVNPTASIDTSAGDTFEYYTSSGTGFRYFGEDATQVDNEFYDVGDGSTATMNVNRFRTDHYWICFDGDLLAMLGTNNDTLITTARSRPVPTNLPNHISLFSAILVQVIIKAGATNIEEINNLQGTQFSASGAIIHNETTNKQGGTTDEYYHTTENENSYLKSYVLTESTVADRLDSYDLFRSSFEVTGAYVSSMTAYGTITSSTGFIGGQSTFTTVHVSSIVSSDASGDIHVVLGATGQKDFIIRSPTYDSVFVAEGDGGRIGIGTEDPSVTLDIYDTNPSLAVRNTTAGDGDTAGTTRNSYYRKQSGGEDSAIGYSQYSHDGTGDDEKGQYGLVLNDGSTLKQYLAVKSDGKVGIGTYNPSAELEVIGEIVASTITADLINTTNLNVSSVAVTEVFYSTSVKIDNLGPNLLDQVQITGGFDMADTPIFNVSSMNAYGTITSSTGFIGGNSTFTFVHDTGGAYFGGSVGIGTTNPTKKLEVYPDTDSSAKIGRAYIGYSVFSDVAMFSHVDQTSHLGRALGQSAAGYTTINSAPGQNIDFRQGNDEKVIISGVNGYVGIGTGITSVVSLLELENEVPYLTLTNNTHEDTDGGRESQLLAKGQQSGGEETTLTKIQSSHDGIGDDQKGDLIFYVNDGDDGDSPTETMRINSSGNVGIGGVNALRAMSIYEKYYLQFINADTGISATDGLIFGIDSVEAVSLWNYEDTDMKIGTNNTERIRIKNGGNVGIGTDAPSSKLDVFNGSITIRGTNAGLNVGDGTIIASSMTAYSTITSSTGFIGGQSTFTFVHNTGGAYFGGNVGIGTVSPSDTLEVQGGIASYNSWPRVISKDSTWGYGSPAPGNNTLNDACWQSAVDGDTATGDLYIGYFVLGSVFHIALKGGNVSQVEIRAKSDDSVLYTIQRGTGDDQWWEYFSPDTSSDAGTVCYLAGVDDDTSGSWGWLAITDFFIEE